MAKMKKRYRRMLETRRLYKLEDDLYYDKRYRHITRKRSYNYLHNLAKTIWAGERIKTKMPNIQFGTGAPHGGYLYSWCDGETIELAPEQRDIITLIHELVHGMGYDYHDREFVRTEARLLKKYVDMDKSLVSQAFSKYEY